MKKKNGKNEKSEKTHLWSSKFGAWSSNLHRVRRGGDTILTKGITLALTREEQ